MFLHSPSKNTPSSCTRRRVFVPRWLHLVHPRYFPVLFRNQVTLQQWALTIICFVREGFFCLYMCVFLCLHDSGHSRILKRTHALGLSREEWPPQYHCDCFRRSSPWILLQTRPSPITKPVFIIVCCMSFFCIFYIHLFISFHFIILPPTPSLQQSWAKCQRSLMDCVYCVNSIPLVVRFQPSLPIGFIWIVHRALLLLIRIKKASREGS